MPKGLGKGKRHGNTKGNASLAPPEVICSLERPMPPPKGYNEAACSPVHHRPVPASRGVPARAPLSAGLEQSHLPWQSCANDLPCHPVPVLCDPEPCGLGTDLKLSACGSQGDVFDCDSLSPGSSQPG